MCTFVLYSFLFLSPQTRSCRGPKKVGRWGRGKPRDTDRSRDIVCNDNDIITNNSKNDKSDNNDNNNDY